MLKNRKALTVALAALVCLLLAKPSFAHAATPGALAVAPSSSSTLLADPAASKIDVAAAMQDRVLGDDKAPVTIDEYASLTCPHCAHFDKEILPEVKKRLIDTGKAKLVFHDFPLDGVALRAAMMTRCVSPIQYYNMIDVIFTKQEFWVKAQDPLAELQKLGSLAGLDAADFKSCTENKDLESGILKEMQTAQQKYKVESTPTFIFNHGADQFAGAQPVEKFEGTVNKLSKGK